MRQFADWLQGEMDTRGWDKAELARRAHVAQMTVGRILSGTRQVGPDVALAIARALGELPENVFRRAGLLPALPAEVAEEREIVAIVREQPEHTRAMLLRMLRGLARRATPARVDSDQAELSAIYERLPAEWRPEFVRAMRMFERNARPDQARIIGEEEHDTERQPAPQAGDVAG